IGNGVVVSLEALLSESRMLMEQGVPVFERLSISPHCPLILPSHVRLDEAREQARGANAIGTTRRGIGPAYEDKVARRAVRVADLFDRERFATKLAEQLDFHNFVLQHYYRAPALDFRQTLEAQLAMGEQIAPLVTDVTRVLHELRATDANVVFEGAQGAMLDVDLGTYPFVTSSNTTAGFAGTGTGLGPRAFDGVVGVVKAYTTRVGAGPFPTELSDEYGEHMSRVGHEFGSVTGRRRRCGWLDAVALERSIVHSSVSGLIITKLDVLDGLDRLSVCVGYRVQGAVAHEPPMSVEAYAGVEPVYEELPGWRESTVGVTAYRSLPHNARRYLQRLESLAGTPRRGRRAAGPRALRIRHRAAAARPRAARARSVRRRSALLRYPAAERHPGGRRHPLPGRPLLALSHSRAARHAALPRGAVRRDLAVGAAAPRVGARGAARRAAARLGAGGARARGARESRCGGGRDLPARALCARAVARECAARGGGAFRARGRRCGRHQVLGRAVHRARPAGAGAHAGGHGVAAGPWGRAEGVAGGAHPRGTRRARATRARLRTA